MCYNFKLCTVSCRCLPLQQPLRRVSFWFSHWRFKFWVCSGVRAELAMFDSKESFFIGSTGMNQLNRFAKLFCQSVYIISTTPHKTNGKQIQMDTFLIGLFEQSVRIDSNDTNRTTKIHTSGVGSWKSRWSIFCVWAQHIKTRHWCRHWIY